jgi:hypothetical protein
MPLETARGLEYLIDTLGNNPDPIGTKHKEVEDMHQKIMKQQMGMQNE